MSWWIRDHKGRVTLAMWPNPAIWVWLVAKVLAWTGLLSSSVSDDTLAAVGTGALLVWAADELFRGASPFRRVLGALVLGFQLVALLT